MIEWQDGRLTDEEAARMSDAEITARMEELQARMAALRHRQELLLEALAKQDPELAAEMRKQMPM